MAKPARELPPLHRPLPVQPGARPKQRQSADGTVSSSVLGRHLDLTYQRVLQLADEHVIERLPSGRFNMDDARLRYIRWLRDPERRSARAQADAEHVKAKTEMLQLKLAEKRRELVRQSDVDALIDELVGVTLTAMSSMPARCAPVAILRPAVALNGSCSK